MTFMHLIANNTDKDFILNSILLKLMCFPTKK